MLLLDVAIVAAVPVAVGVATFVYGRKHQRWTRERRAAETRAIGCQAIAMSCDGNGTASSHASALDPLSHRP